MFSFDYSDFPQQQTLLPNFHSPQPYTSFSHERNPFQFHHQTLNLPHQMGIFLPQTHHQDPNAFAPPNAHGDASLIPNSSPLYEFTCKQGSLGVLSPVKKDRHSKISTAHGVRDRRVRLSMAIAREFFDLQDMLGFDKASKTIGWLLAKSKGAIQELTLAKQGSDPDLSRSDSSSSSHHEDTFANSSTDTVTRMGTRKRSVSSTPNRRRSRKSASKEENEKVSFENQANFIAARENRARARARARERTREKLSAVVKSIEFDDHTSGRTSCSSHLLTDSKPQSISRPLHDQNVIRSRHSPPLLSCSGYLQSILSAPTGDQDASVRANCLPNLIMGSNNSESAICSSLSGWNIFSFPSEMHMTSKPWENQAQQQYNQQQGELR